VLTSSGTVCRGFPAETPAMWQPRLQAVLLVLVVLVVLVILVVLGVLGVLVVLLVLRDGAPWAMLTSSGTACRGFPAEPTPAMWQPRLQVVLVVICMTSSSSTTSTANSSRSTCTYS